MEAIERKEQIKSLIISRLNLKVSASEIKDNTPLFTSKEEGGLGLDSVDALELAVTINNEFDVTVSDDDMSIFNTVQSMNDFIEEKSTI